MRWIAITGCVLAVTLSIGKALANGPDGFPSIYHDCDHAGPSQDGGQSVVRRSSLPDCGMSCCGCGSACASDICGCDFDSCGSADGCGDTSCYQPGCNDCNVACRCAGLTLSSELLWFRFHRADGLRVGIAAGEEAEFDFETTPRVTIGWTWCDGTGLRGRWWEFDHNTDAAEGGGSQFQVDTYQFDLEGYETFCLNCNWDLELSAGVRYNHFVEQMIDNDGAAAAENRRNLFHGYGGIVAAELRRAVYCGQLWARARFSILMDDTFVSNTAPDLPAAPGVRLTDSVVSQTELALGYDFVMPMCDCGYLYLRSSAEWQHWSNFSSNFPGITGTESFVDHSDVGFGGFGVGLGWMH